jgi:group I intron endonuclease
MNVNGIIYKVTHIESGRVYIGQTYSEKNKTSEQLLENRKIRHLRSARSNTDKKAHFHHALNMYGVESFTWEIIAVATGVDELNRMEANFIKSFQSSSDENGFNTRIEGENKLFTSLAKMKMSGAAKGRWDGMTDAERANYVLKQQVGRDKRPELRLMASKRMHAQLSNPQYVQLMTERRSKALLSEGYKELRSKLSKKIWEGRSEDEKKAHMDRARYVPQRLESLRAKIKTPEYVKNITEANRNRRKRQFQVLTVSGDEVVSEFDNIIDAAKYFGNPAPNISAVLRGKAKTFMPNKAEFLRLGRLYARWQDDLVRPPIPRFDCTRKNVAIIRIDTGECVAQFRGVIEASRVLGKNISSALHGRTQSFTASNAEFVHFGRLTAIFVEADGD